MVKEFHEDEVEWSIEGMKGLAVLSSTLGILCQNPKKRLEQLLKVFDLVEAAGGVVLNNRKEMLWIMRLGKWDLPKGKIERGEGKKEAAIREVEEETGITDLKLKQKVVSTFHTYNVYGAENIKCTYWYAMETNFEGDGIAQIEEEITEVRWVSIDNLEEQLNNTYGSIKQVVGLFLQNR